MDEITRQVNRSGRDGQQRRACQRRDVSNIPPQNQDQPDGPDAKDRRDESNGDVIQPICVAARFSEQKSREPGNYCGEIIKRWPMKVRGVVFVLAIADKLQEKVAIDALIVMKRHETKMI